MTVPAGFRGVVTLLSGTLPEESQPCFLVEENERGVQARTLEPGTYPLNPVRDAESAWSIAARSGFNPAQDTEMDFLLGRRLPDHPRSASSSSASSPAGRPRSSAGTSEDQNGDAIDEEIITKIITPESRSLCRIGGSKLSGGQFISGDERREVPA